MIRKAIISLLSLLTLLAGVTWMASYSGYFELGGAGRFRDFFRSRGATISIDSGWISFNYRYPTEIPVDKNPNMAGTLIRWCSHLDETMVCQNCGTRYRPNELCPRTNTLLHGIPPSHSSPSYFFVPFDRHWDFGVASWSTKRISTKRICSNRSNLFTVSLWLPFALFAIYPICVLARGPIRRWWRRKQGRCINCGYDLHANESGLCPECGTSVPNDPPTST